MNLRPLHDQVILKRAKPDEKSEGGILLPNVEGRISIFADVIAAGPESSVSAGDRVVLGGWAGKPFTVEGEDLLCVKDEDVLAVLS